MRLKQIEIWAKSRGVNVERINPRRVDVYTDGGMTIECHNMQEVINAVWEFIRAEKVN